MTFVFYRSGDSEKMIDRQISAPSGYVSSTSPIVIKRVHIKKEESSSVPTSTKLREPVDTVTATATIKITPAQARTARRIKINVVKPEENKENVIKPTDKTIAEDSRAETDQKVHTDKITLTLPLKI